MLAAVDGPPDSPSQHQHASKQCPGDDEDGRAAEDDRDHEPDEGVEEDDEEDDEEDEGGRGEKEGEEMEEVEDQGDRKPRPAGGQFGLEWPPAANPQPPYPPQQLPLAPQPPRASRQSPTQQPPSIHQPPATHEPAGDPGSGSGDEVLGS